MFLNTVARATTVATVITAHLPVGCDLPVGAGPRHTPVDVGPWQTSALAVLAPIPECTGAGMAILTSIPIHKRLFLGIA
jgi:hypothetical protein